MAARGKKLTLIYILTILVCLFGALYSNVALGTAGYYIYHVLWAMSWYYIVVLFTQKSRSAAFISSLIICAVLEALQLIDLTWLNELRATTLGSWFLGDQFRWTDLACSAGGCLAAWLIDIWGYRR